ncbi:tail length tape-measure protein 1 [Vibrio phage vB_VhaS-tm]|nr:tail length tape-measure protein 1 [Vibrio phage vB_VhaS-tm]
MTDLARLQIRIESLEADVAEKRLKKLQKTGAGAERATDGLMGAFKRFAGPAAIAAGAVAALTKTVEVTRQFDVLNAQLITATGSAERAAVAFEAIQDFATETPYDLQQATEGFSKLVNLGLTPSERAMRSYGDTASAMGKDMIQMVEAVADATTGEFERLKEFGIRSKKNGDEVAFTFRGVTETVKFNAEEIEEYLIRLGENNFAGAMAERMDTLDGAISNLGDEWNKLWLNVSQQGVGDTIESGVRLAIDGLQELNDMLASGEMTGYLTAIASKFDGFVRDFDEGMGVMNDLWAQVPEEWKAYGTAAIDFIVDSFVNLPENLRLAVQLMGIELASLIEYGKVYGEAFVDVIVAKFDELVAKAKAYGVAIGEALNPFAEGGFDLEGELARIEGEYAKTSGDAWGKATKQAEAISKVRRAAIGEIKAEYDTALDSYNKQIEKAQQLREEYEKEKKARQANAGDRLEQFKTGGTTEEGEDQQTEAQKKAQQRRFDALVDSLRTEEERIQESYNRRLAIILENTEEGSQQQADLKKRLNEQFAEEATGGIFDTPETYDEQLAAIEEQYARRREIILENVQLTEEQRTELEAELTQKRNELIEGLEQQRMRTVVQASAQGFGAMADLAKTFAGEQSGIYRVMFAASKAFAIADSIMKIQQGIANAASLPWPANLGAIASTVAATAGIVNTIQGVQMQGYRKGGYTGDGGVDDVAGVVHGQEYVFDAAATRRIGRDNLERMRQGAPMDSDKGGDNTAPASAPQALPSPTNIRIINSVDPSLMAEYMGSTEGEKIIMNVVRRNGRTIKTMVA